MGTVEVLLVSSSALPHLASASAPPRFHNECLRQWGDTSCPVCRYCTHSGATTSHCATCNTSSGELLVVQPCYALPTGFAGSGQGSRASVTIPSLLPGAQHPLLLASVELACGYLLSAVFSTPWLCSQTCGSASSAGMWGAGATAAPTQPHTGRPPGTAMPWSWKRRCAGVRTWGVMGQAMGC